MGLIGSIFAFLFGDGRNVVRETAEVFRENAEAGAERAAQVQDATLRQFAGEFGRGARGFDRVMDGVNRLPRPALALGTLALFISAMVDPVWFAARMQGIALVPEPLWWLLGVIVSFYFGARHQLKAQTFQREIAATLAAAPVAVDNIRHLQALAQNGDKASVPEAALEPDANPALEVWRAGRKAR